MKNVNLKKYAAAAMIPAAMAPIVSEAAAPEAVKIFENAGFAGGSVTLNEKLNGNGLTNYFYWEKNGTFEEGANDLISSVQVPAGYQVTLYEHFDGAGGEESALTLEHSRDFVSEFNDKVTAIMITKEDETPKEEVKDIFKDITTSGNGNGSNHATLVSVASVASTEELVKLTPVDVENIDAYKVEVQCDKIDSMKINYGDNKLVVTSGESVQELVVGDNPYATYFFVRDNGQGITKATPIMQGGEDALVLKTENYNNLYVREAKFALTVSDHDAYGAEYIEELLNRGVVHGYSAKYDSSQESFVVDAKLKNNITRAQFALILGRVLEATPKGDNKFADIKGTEEFANFTTALNEIGIITGSEGNFRPYENITKEQAAAIVCRMLRHLGVDTTPVGTSEFKDFDKVSDYAKNDVLFLEGHDLFEKDDTGMLNPQEKATRGEVFLLLSHAMIFSQI